eukprot:TRINITY_DN13379_c1_g1_i1.p1 TRINITY_DN13379_c1_g1~~TRINITY_DN13379_c1_g1_i1.p1  ORF type:complete len:330 (+),score=40.62 TRINITY_DN13379_c1_g1_i1:105-992(+)
MAALQVAAELILNLFIKNTFLHFNVFPKTDRKRTSSCPPRVQIGRREHGIKTDCPTARSKSQQSGSYFTKNKAVDKVGLEEFKDISGKVDSDTVAETTLISAKTTTDEEASSVQRRRNSLSDELVGNHHEAKDGSQNRLSCERRGGNRPLRGNRPKPKPESFTTSPVILRGLPYHATERDVTDFLCEQGIGIFLAVQAPVAMVNSRQGKSSGLAELRLTPDADMRFVHRMVHKKYLGKRYVEVLLPNTSAWRAAVQNQTEGQVRPSNAKTVCGDKRDPKRKTKGTSDLNFRALFA